MPLRKLLKLFLVQLFSLVVLSQAISAQPYIIETLVGQGSAVSGPAISAELPRISSMTSDRSGNIYALWLGVVVKIDASGHLTRVFGNGTTGHNGDGGPAVAAQFGGMPATSGSVEAGNIAVDPAGNIFIAEPGRIRRIEAVTGIVTTAVGGYRITRVGPMKVLPSRFSWPG